MLSFFLCGAVVTYVGSANNYRQLAMEREGTIDTLESENALAKRQSNEMATQMQALEAKLNEQIDQLSQENERLAAQVNDAKREALAYRQQTESWKGLIANFENTIAQMEQSRELTRDQLNSIRQDLIRERKELNEITAMLYERTIQIESLEADRRRFREQKAALENQLESIMQGQAVPGPTGAVTQPINQAQAAMEAAPSQDMGLKGVINEVGANLVTISLGSADGVTEGMVFHATRGADFLADIVITDVDVNKAAGVLELVQERPRVGDLVSTNL